MYVRNRAGCFNPEQIWLGPDLSCVSSVRRTVWAGDQELVEVQYPGGEGLSAAELERDTVTITPDSRFYGRVLYTPGGGLDRPLGLIRVGYVQPYNAPGNIPFGPIGVSPHWSARGIADWGSYDDGAALRCQNNDPTDSAKCVELQFLGGLSAFHRSYVRQTSWFGSLIDDKRDGSGQNYRRNRYFDSNIGRFTQEDPIGLAGGLSAYGFAAGDPVSYSDPFGLAPQCSGFWNCVAELAKMEWRGFTAGSDPTGLTPLGENQGQLGYILGKLSFAGAGAGRVVLGGGAAAVADGAVVVRGGQGAIPAAGEVFSGAVGRTLEEAASGVPHGTIRATTAGEIRAGGGTVELKPEVTRSGAMNDKHANICLGAGSCPFGEPMPNPVPKSERIQ